MAGHDKFLFSLKKIRKSAISGIVALRGSVCLLWHQSQNWDHLDWYNLMVDFLLGLAMRDAAFSEKPFALIPRSIASKRDI